MEESFIDTCARACRRRIATQVAVQDGTAANNARERALQAACKNLQGFACFHGVKGVLSFFFTATPLIVTYSGRPFLYGG